MLHTQATSWEATEGWLLCALSLSLSLSLSVFQTHPRSPPTVLSNARESGVRPRRGAIGLHLLAQPQRVPRQAIDIDSFPSERPSLGPPGLDPVLNCHREAFFREFRCGKMGSPACHGQTTREKSARFLSRGGRKLVEQVEVRLRATSQASAGRSVHARNGGDVSVSERLWSSYFST